MKEVGADGQVRDIVATAVAPKGTRRYADRPLLVFWETTKACDLVCEHCRADAKFRPGADDLTTDEALGLIEELANVGRPRPILILTGGDCLQREDLTDIVRSARRHDLPVAIAPSVTPRLNDLTLARLRREGVKSASVSLDGACADTHEGIRGVEGHFAQTLDAIARLRRHGFTVQINTAVTNRNLSELADIAKIVHESGASIWELFFLIETGRGTTMHSPDAEINEDVCHFLVDAAHYGFTVRTVEAPFFRRVAAQRGALGEAPPEFSFSFGPLYYDLRDRLRELLGEPTSRRRAPSAVTRDGQGVIFVANNGDIYPSGFLPWRIANVREHGLLRPYREDALLQSIRNNDFSGACASCQYVDLCGGSRSRAYASSGDPLGEDPGCVLTLSEPITLLGSHLRVT